MSDDPFDLTGTTIDGRYRVEKLVEVTRQSVVYRAVHRVWRRPVAIKAFRGVGAGCTDEDSRKRMLASFVREGALLMELSERCASICQARDVSALTAPNGEWVPYMVLEWLEGQSLDAMLVSERERGAQPRTVTEAICLLDPIARALTLAHERGIVHGDIKPGNAYVLASGCKLLDFGVASVLREGLRAVPDDANRSFTPAYGAPEQFSPTYGTLGPWTDVYALALVFVEVVGGREPLGDGSIAALMRRSCDADERPTPRALGASVSDAVERCLCCALAVKPEDRFESAGRMWSALKSAAPSSWIDSSTTIPIPLQRRRGVKWPWVAPS